MSKKDLKQLIGIAYHEAGHCVIGYTVGHTANYIDANLDESNKIYPHVDKNFQSDELIIQAFYNKDITYLNSLNIRDVVDTADRYCQGLLAGTYAEFYKLYGFNMNPSRNKINPIDMDKLKSCLNILNSLGSNASQDELYDFSRNKIEKTIRKKSIWIKIKRIANLILESSTLRVDNKAIETIINK